MRFAEVPIIFPDRVRGASKMSWRIVVEAAWLVLRLRFGGRSTPIRTMLSPIERAADRRTPA